MGKIILILLLFVCGHSFSQDSSAIKTNQITRKWPGLKMNGERLSWKELKTELNKVPESAIYFKKATNCQIIGYSFVAASLPFTLLSRYRNINKPRYGESRTGFQITSIILAGTGMFFVLRSTKFLKKAIRLHNEHFVKVY